MDERAKAVEFRGSALEDLRSFPTSARRDAGHQLDLLQQGFNPDDWKPMTSIGPGVREIRIRDAHGVFRVIYIAKFKQAIFVLHCFQKRSQKTRREDIAVAIERYTELVRDLRP